MRSPVGGLVVMVLCGLAVAQPARAEMAPDNLVQPDGTRFGLSNYENDGWKPLIDRQTVFHCASYGCRRLETFRFTTDDLLHLAIIMSEGLVDGTPKSERAAMAKAIAWMERRVGRALGTDRDKPSIGFFQAGQSGQQDCVDEARNTAAYISLLHANGLITHHQRPKIVSRGNILRGAFPHYGVVIKERGRGRLWAVDSGVTANGGLPRIETAKQWFARGRSRVPRGL